VTLVEVMISLAASTMILGALFVSAFSIQKVLHGSETYSVSYGDQKRLSDYLGRDLRRAIEVDFTDSDGNRRPLGLETVSVQDRATLILTLPDYYQSDDPTNPNYTAPQPVTTNTGRIDYGSAGTVEVTFRKIFVGSEGSTCYVRQEAANEQVIVGSADNLTLQISLSPDGCTGLVKSWFRAPYSTIGPLVSTSEQFMLRNPIPLPGS
jgi:hypothetical protein